MIVVPNLCLGSIPACPLRPRPRRLHAPRGLPQSNLSESTSLTSQAKRKCQLFDLYKEQVPYEKAWAWQKSIVKERKMLIDKDQDWSDSAIILQHDPVYTLGTGSSEDNLNFDVIDSPYPVHRTERGGEVTYHGPGQLVMYPIINLRYHKMDLHWYLRALEEVVIRVLFSTFSIKASRRGGLTGVWVGDQKLAAMGIRAAQWITYHGLALNVTTDLAPFDWIVPCGIRNMGVGSIKRLLSEGVMSSNCHGDDHQLIEITHQSLVKEFLEVFQLELCEQPVPSSSFPGQKHYQ